MQKCISLATILLLLSLGKIDASQRRPSPRSKSADTPRRIVQPEGSPVVKKTPSLPLANSVVVEPVRKVENIKTATVNYTADYVNHTVDKSPASPRSPEEHATRARHITLKSSQGLKRLPEIEEDPLKTV